MVKGEDVALGRALTRCLYFPQEGRHGGEVKEGEGGKEEQGGHREGEEKRGLI